MKKIDIKKIVTGAFMAVMVLIQALITSVPVYASETSDTDLRDSENIFYDPNSKNNDGFYYYLVRTESNGEGNKKNAYIRYYYIKSEVPICYVPASIPSNGNYDGYQICLLFNNEVKFGSTYGKMKLYKFISQFPNRENEDILLEGTEAENSTFSSMYAVSAVPYPQYNYSDYYKFSCTAPIFTSLESAEKYLRNNDDSSVSNKQPTVNNKLYLKNLKYNVTAENSSEYPDETFIHFTWDIDNLQQGDLLEVKTKNHYTKLGGDQIIGFNDYITANDSVSAFSGKYDMSQTDAVKKWFSTVENKPLVFKDYDTDIYFLRPVRGSELGLWVKVVMGRKTPTSSPYIKDIEYGDLSEDGDWTKNEDITSSEGGNHGFNQKGDVIAPGLSNPDGGTVDINSIWDLFKYLWSQLNTLVGYFGQLPQLINQVIGWLPSPVIVLICGSIILVIILRIFGR